MCCERNSCEPNPCCRAEFPETSAGKMAGLRRHVAALPPTLSVLKARNCKGSRLPSAAELAAKARAATARANDPVAVASSAVTRTGGIVTGLQSLAAKSASALSFDPMDGK